jgi:hypothetical protein
MSTPPDTAEIRARRLARFAELAESIAEHLHDEILAAETAQDKRDLTLAFHRITRSARQTMALEAKLERDETLEIVARLAEVERIAQEPVRRRKAQIAAAIERLIWHEREDDGVELSLKLSDLMDEDDLHDRFAEGSAEDHIRRLCLALGLAGPKDDILIYPTATPPPEQANSS